MMSLPDLGRGGEEKGLLFILKLFYYANLSNNFR